MNEDMMKLAEEYAAVAQNLLEDQGEPYTEEDIAKVAEFLIENDYPSEDAEPAAEENDFDKLAEEAFLAGFEDEMQKQAMRTPNRMAADIGEYLIDKLVYLKKQKINGEQYLGKKKNPTRYWLANHPKTVGYGAMGLGAAAIGGGGYAGYSAMNKQSEFNKEAAWRSPNRLATDLGEFLLDRLAYPKKGLFQGERYIGAKRNPVRYWLANHPKTVGYGAAGVGAGVVGGAGYAGYRASRG